MIRPSTSKPAAIFFDLDGTLIDSAPDLAAAADLMRTRRGLSSIAFEHYRPMAGAGARGMLKIAFEITPEHPDYLSKRDEFLNNYAASLTTRTYAFEGVAAMLKTLNATNMPWGIVTNKHQRFTAPLVAQLPALHGALTVISGDTTPYAKPNPAPLLEACNQTGQFPTHCWYVGDDKRDIEAAHACGMIAIAVTWGYEGEHALETWGADHVLHQPQQLVDLLSATIPKKL